MRKASLIIILAILLFLCETVPICDDNYRPQAGSYTISINDDNDKPLLLFLPNTTDSNNIWKVKFMDHETACKSYSPPPKA